MKTLVLLLCIYSGGGNKISPLFYAKTFGISRKGCIFAAFKLSIGKRKPAISGHFFYACTIAANILAALYPRSVA